MMSYIKKILQTKSGWGKEFNKIHSDLLDEDVELSKLRFIIACGRSGTSWLGRVISETSTPLRYCHEILTYVNPFYYFSKKNDFVANRYFDKCDADNPLVKIYSATSSKKINLDKFLPKRTRQIKRNDQNFEFVLHKEVHALLATEALVSFFKTPFLLITRNPAYVVDSLFDYHPLNSVIWRNESEYIKDPVFLNRFFPDSGQRIIEMLSKYPDDGMNRENTIIAKAITVGVINKMLYSISKKYENVMYIKYEELCKNPFGVYEQIFNFFGFDFGEKARQSIANTTKAKDEKYDPMSICRNSGEQVERKLKSLTDEEFKKVSNILSELGLSVEDY